MHTDGTVGAEGCARERLPALCRLGFVGSATYTLLPRCLPPFRERYPELSLELVEGTTLGVVEMLRSGAVDIGLIRGPLFDATGLRVDLVESDEFVAVLPVGHPLAGRSRLRLAALRDEPGTPDELIVRLGCAPRELAAQLLTLELDGLVVVDRDGRMHAAASAAIDRGSVRLR